MYQLSIEINCESTNRSCSVPLLPLCTTISDSLQKNEWTITKYCARSLSFYAKVGAEDTIRYDYLNCLDTPGSTSLYFFLRIESSKTSWGGVYAYHMDYNHRISCWRCRQVCNSWKRSRWIHCHHVNWHCRRVPRNLFGAGNRVVRGWPFSRLHRCCCWFDHSPVTL